MTPCLKLSWLFCFLLLSAAQLRAKGEVTCFVSQPGSTVTIYGGNQMHDWQIQGSEIGGFAEFEGDFPVAAKPGKVAVHWDGFIPVRTLHISEGKSMDRSVYYKLLEEANPRILFRVSELILNSWPRTNTDPYVFNARAELVVAGVTNRVSLPIQVLPLAGNKLKISATAAMKMTDFGIQPPQLQASSGTIKGITINYRDDVTVSVEWLVSREVAADIRMSGAGQPAGAKPTSSLADFKKSWLEARAQAAEKEKLLVREIHKKIVATPTENSEAGMKPYTNTVAVPNRGYSRDRTGPSVTFVSVMVPIKGGEFTMGSPEAEKDHQADEGPQHKVKISPFWMQQCEITWDEFEPFMQNFEAPAYKEKNSTYVSNYLDGVSKPSKPYVPPDRGMGKSGFPAISMTQHAANKYCEWLSTKTGHFYRLPTEAEWEYACRAGTTSAYSFGENREKLRDYGWFYDNSSSKYQKVGKKKPNPWGLYDMHGNVAEWCLDQYAASFYREQKEQVSVSPWNKATAPYPHVVRGGSWWDDPDQLRSAARKKSDKSWKSDPSLPPSIWYADQADFVGFRVVRPLLVPDAEQMFHYWNSGVEHEMFSGKGK